ncbi:hypothetical protein H6770_03490 [Candidatus Peribacteria bacterium]|nr:hypothetical protein [Candidatus Peribacteria bacterium]
MNNPKCQITILGFFYNNAKGKTVGKIFKGAMFDNHFSVRGVVSLNTHVNDCIDTMLL